ncbi:hypothetical protein DD238_005000 [Peronospora effusa]|uniref:Uncharacterized protein n=1 Tax=Peronospora effusa TaxID=542832 RepID=A0A3M6VCC1_9STRA|nr:hypothetical protein DD238_005000 [Peronospora effusa]RQM13003.1 hypothetical protein DD237_005804 [Peronospora effusa]
MNRGQDRDTVRQYLDKSWAFTVWHDDDWWHELEQSDGDHGHGKRDHAAKERDVRAADGSFLVSWRGCLHGHANARAVDRAHRIIAMLHYPVKMFMFWKHLQAEMERMEVSSVGPEPKQAL